VHFESVYLVDTRDVDHQGHCRPSALLGFLQETATVAGAALGVDRETMKEKHNCFWMLARIRVELERPLRWKDEVMIRTWHRTPRGASIYRDFDLFVNGEYAGQAVSTWVLADYDSHKLVRMDTIPELKGTQGGAELEKNVTLSRTRMPEEMPVTERRLLHYSETDMNGHINNTRYADFACDAIRADLLPDGTYVAGMQLGYHAECHPGEIIDLFVARGEDDCFVHGIDETGKSRFDVQIFLGQDIP